MMLALDIGGTKIAAAQVIGGQCVERRQLPMPDNEADFLGTVRALCEGRPAFEQIAVAVTGYTDGHTVRGVNGSIIPFWNAFPLGPRLQALLGCRVLILNDAQAAAWGEYTVRSRADCRDLLFMTLSTGVGAGLVLDGRLRTGTQGLAGHFGHASLPSAEPLLRCGCGRLGCLETLASGTALARRATAAYGRAMTAQQLFQQADAGDARAGHLLNDAARAVAEAIANAQAQLDLQQVLLGGSVGLAPGMAERVQAALADLPALFQLPVERARLGADAGLVGVADWASTRH